MTGSVLVTGAAGFVGRHLVAALLRRGEKVRALDLSFEPELPGAECIVGSVTDPDGVAEALAGIEFVFHCAANPQLWSSDPQAFTRVNVEGTRIVLETARRLGVKRAVHVSSFVTLMAKRLAGQTVDEQVKLQPADMLGPYPLSKYLSERLALDLAGDGFQVVAALPSAPIGPLDYKMTPPTKLIRDLVRGRVPATLKCRMNVIDVRMLADGLIAARDRGRSGERYLLTGEDLSMAAFLETLASVSGVRMPKRTVPGYVALTAALIDEKLVARVTGKRPAAPLSGVQLAATNIRFDNSRARSELGLNTGSTREALQDALTWMQAEGLLRRHAGNA